MTQPPREEPDRRGALERAYGAVRTRTERLASPLSPEDQTVQSMPDASPTKWHLGHTSWFFETFVLEPELASYAPHHPNYGYLFNSYYEAVGPRQPRPERGLLTRPSAAAVARYRAAVDAAMEELFEGAVSPSALDVVELGIHHEQQHQELLLMDVKHLFSRNPMAPAYALPQDDRALGGHRGAALGWIGHDGGAREIGHSGDGFAFDNESPRHVTQLVPFALADRLVTCGEWAEFIADGGYVRPELWLSEGWATVQAERWAAPLYWLDEDGHDPGFRDRDHPSGARSLDCPNLFTLFGVRPVDTEAPVSHVSYYEADAFARWRGARLPTEAEWETAAPLPPTLPDLDLEPELEPRPQSEPGDDFYGALWQWTSTSYGAYPGFRAGPGAIGEYNGKFMVNQQVLRGSACVTPPGHARRTYRNFFPARARWAFSGIRLAQDL